MTPFNGLGKLLIVLGGILIVIGAAIVLGGKLPWFGRLPGDIYLERRNFTFFFPITTSILISVILSVVLYILSRR
jgi:membrane protein implicated in regulation of membrane protease activity